VTTRDTAEVSRGTTRSPRAKGVTITVRLFPEIHGAVLEELARVPCGSRSARVIHLLTIGLIYEHACGSGRVSQASVSSPGATDAVGPDTVGMRSDDLTFVSALMEGAGR
jgi:hypothetical protein